MGFDDLEIRRRTVLAGLLERLPGAKLDGTDSVSAVVEGQPVKLTLQIIEYSSSRSFRTRATAPIALHLFLEVRPSTGTDEREVRRGEAVDFVVGDPAFDAAFIVEGAPERHLRTLLDPAVRATFTAAQPAVLHTQSSSFVVVAEDWVADIERALAMVHTVGRVAANAAVLAEAEKRDAATYRGGGGGQKEKDRREMNVALGRYNERIRRRGNRQAYILLVVIVLVLGAGMTTVLFTR